LRVNKYYFVSLLIILPVIFIISCLNEPEYLTIKKTEIPRPVDLNIGQNDAFSLTLSWLISTESLALITAFKIERFALDNQLTITNSEFSTFIHDMPNAEQILLRKDELSFYLNSAQDTIVYTHIDTGSTFNAYNYYRVTALSDEIISYSYFTDKGTIFELGDPQSFQVFQLNDSQLQLSWNVEEYADGYKLFRYDSLLHIDTSFMTSDTFYVDSSFNPQIISNGIDISYLTEGLTPNELYNYSIWAFSDSGSQRRYSRTGSTLENISLNLLRPKIKRTRAQNSHTTRIYIESSTLDAHIDTIIVYEYDLTLENWGVLDTGLVSTMNHIIDKDLESCHVVDIHNVGESKFIILAKGETNGAFSNDTLGGVFPFHNYELIEGGYFGTTSQWIDLFYLSSIEYVEQFAFINKSINNELLSDGQNFPSDSISWVDAVLLCDQFSLATGYNIRLPSELEWEYAALKDVFSDDNSWQFDYPWGSNVVSGEHANYINSGDLWDNSLTPVAYYNGENGTYDNSSSFGVYDLAGNVLEWCGSGSQMADMNTIDMGDSSITGDQFRELRGGGYWHEAELLKSNIPDDFRYNGELAVLGLGFRILIEESE
jgi:hypothetical protein